ncbi:oxidoreductase [Lachnospiraceae bacterium KM106-2]|nr:oxidoreductase [Lachnospiraceae bacterium KM106-2]
MKLVIAGAFGKLGSDLLRQAIKEGYEVVAVDQVIRKIEGLDPGSYQAKQIDITKTESLMGICEGADAVITTVGLTKTSATLTNYDIDYHGNKNLLDEAVRAKVKKFVYISVLKADGREDVPMLHAKYLMEQELKKSGISYVIHRPTGYFYDIAHVFMPMIEKGKVTLLGKKPVHANVIDTADFACFIMEHLKDLNVTYDVGGKETYSYEEIARMFFAAAGKTAQISYAPPWLFDVLAKVNKWKKNGKEAIIKFSKWTLSNEMVGDTKYGERSFKEYVRTCYQPNNKH